MSILEKITSLSKRRGFIYPDSEIYGGMKGSWDYGPLGSQMKKNIKDLFWKEMVQKNNNIIGIDASIVMNPKVWEASGHVESFTDPLVECKKCKKRFRADHIETKKCPSCGGELGEARVFNLLVEASFGAVEGEKQAVYLRGEITQGVHTNFKQILDTTRIQIPFGVAQFGKAFRNEITPGKLTFRSREFEQMELQFYVKPEEKESSKWFNFWQNERMNWYKNLGIKKENLKFREHGSDELAHYAKMAVDIEYKMGDEWLELEGIHHRGDWDLKRHQEYSGQSMEYLDNKTNEKFIPWIIETSGGIDRAALFMLVDAYFEDEENNRTVLKLHPKIAPYKAAVFPLLSNKPELVNKAKSVYEDLKEEFNIDWDDRGNIGKRYKYQDEMGTPLCVTIDFDTLEDNTVTIRDRDTMKQVRVKINEIKNHIEEKINETLS
ncbi:MAG: glycine--tRNA ligase [Candidatus Paceibacterota bacterium]